ncbi:hypothetical protein [Mycolicibacterium fortuitum]|uniref:Uncharacterized protein n=2 Tax=Mycolicibacterium fortuitum TaxID=1766 RepID=A0AAE4VI32_MYCFO|nr:hypothetical protein [Mycolicibacterium fortuitum]MCV7142872.1 hypothetical protein [Mycolicibacterium fortuitum]MDV7195115.1 hypothetical protein [Mycolicibacterium fortuitum]MDV7208816.1 hypothetical protein [Mycolicibacterium fortuitum]MDV7230730.1 hypothetical protein [Mycolicibacterium fortuitum]MDV7262249.1 hypothetical protein [Mycolicibacterium fortuitum]
MRKNSATPTSNLPEPAGAEILYDWHDGDRYFYGESWPLPAGQWTEEARVAIQGRQFENGKIEYEIAVGHFHPDMPMSDDEALRLALTLIEAVRAVQDAKKSDAKAMQTPN